ncbi:MAG TPA: tRNA lysidine(34) synthetase TilS [Xanthobacteraceae bacterium]|nr:tRNA lysidine(34) synthetase TilS [Xanthobacteraceae bacterium]
MCAAEAAPLDAAALARLFSPFEAHPVLLLAVSGGPDSTALMLLAQRWRALRPFGPVLHAASVDHGLRAAGADEAAAAGRLAAKLGLPHATLAWTGDKPQAGVPEAARNARYALLLAQARALGATALATAHTLDDQAETVLFRLARGSGLAGLAGMAAGRDAGGIALLRPLLGMPKAALIAECRRAGAPFAEDPSNQDPRYTRARLRTLLPRLAHEGLDAPRLAAFAARMARAEAALATASEAAWAELAGGGAPDFRFESARFAALPEEISLRLLGRAVGETGGRAPELGKLEALHRAVLEAARGGAPAARTLAGAAVRADARRVRIRPAPPRRSRACAAGTAG